MTAISLLPKYDRQNAWLEILPPLPPATMLEGAIEADHVVVGGGFGGLAAARRLAELNPAASIVLIEADRIGNNAAGDAAVSSSTTPTTFEPRVLPTTRRTPNVALR